jgi:hypothetical protein
MAEGAAMALGGLALGFACGYWLAQVAGSFLGDLKMPGILPVAGSALVQPGEGSHLTGSTWGRGTTARPTVA